MQEKNLVLYNEISLLYLFWSRARVRPTKWKRNNQFTFFFIVKLWHYLIAVLKYKLNYKNNKVLRSFHLLYVMLIINNQLEYFHIIVICQTNKK